MRALRALIVIGTALACASPAPADPLYCSTWQQITTCSSPDGYLSREWDRDGMTIGQDSDGRRWTTSRWQGFTTTTVEPSPGR